MLAFWNGGNPRVVRNLNRVQMPNGDVAFNAKPDPDNDLFLYVEAGPTPNRRIGERAGAVSYTNDGWTITATRTVETDPNFDLMAMKLAQKIIVDEQAEAARGRYITDGAGQAMSYREKAAEADDCLLNHTALNPPPADKYPLLESEVGYRGADVLAVGTTVQATRDSWKLIEKNINGIRVKAKADIDNAVNAQAVLDVVAALTWPEPS